MQFWQALAFTEADQLVEVAKTCEAVGFDGVLLGDHILHFERRDPAYPYSADGQPPFSAETDWPDCWSVIGMLGAVTQRLRFLTFVYVLPLRHPIEVAKATATAATFCEGRVCLGAGAGWMHEEFDVLGVDFHTRGKRFDESIAVLRKLWTGETVEHHGRFFDFPRVQMRPVPRQPIPLYIGGATPAALRRAARLGDGWLSPGQTLEQALETLARLRQLRTEVGRGQDRFETIMVLNGPPQLDSLKRLQDAGVDGVVHYAFTHGIGPHSTFAQKRAYVEGYADTIIAKLKR